MGNESSQIAGASQNTDGIIIKRDPEARENDNINEVATWEGGVRNESLRGRRSTRAGTTRKKKKRNQQQSAPVSEALNNALSKRNQHGVGKNSKTQRQPKTENEAENVNNIQTALAIELTRQKTTDLRAKKQRLLAAAAAAAGDADKASVELSSEEHAYAHDLDHGSESSQELALKSDKLEPWKQSESVLRMNRNEALKLKTRLSNQVATTNDSRSRISTGRHLLTPDANSKSRGSQVGLHSSARQAGNLEMIRQKRGSIPKQKEFGGQSEKRAEKHAENGSHVDSSEELDPDTSTIHSHNRMLHGMNQMTTYKEDPQLDSDVSTPYSSPQSPAKFGSNKRATLEPRTVQRKGKRNPQPWEVSTRSEPQEDMSVIDPALRLLDIDIEPAPQQIGVYREFEVPPTMQKRKRRLPMNDDYGESMVVEGLHKRARKSLVQPKPPRPSATKTSNFTLRSLGEDSDVAQPTSKKNQSKEKGQGRKNSEANRAMAMGRFTEAEFAIVEQEMLTHRKIHDLTVFDQNQMIQDTRKNDTAMELWENICSMLPDRPRQNIMRVLRRRFHNFLRGSWSKEEEKELKEAYERSPARWVDISKLLNRHPDDCRDRWRNYVVCGDRQKKESWSEDEESQLKLAVGECIQAVRELKAAEMANHPGISRNDQPDIDLIDWQIVSAKLGHTRSRLQCLNKYKLLAKMTNEDDDNVPDLEIHERSWRVTQSKKVIERMRRNDYLELLWAIRNSQAGREGKVPWQKLGDMDFREKWPCMTRKVAWRRLREKIPGNKEMKFQDIVTLLIDNLSPENNYLGEDEGHSILNRIDSHLANELGEDEFDPDDVEEGHNLSTYDRNQRTTSEMVQEAVEAYEDENSWNERSASGDDFEEIDNDMVLEDSYVGTAESVDLDAPSQKNPAAGKAVRLRSPIDFKATAQRRTSDYSGSLTHSDEDDADMDIPARRAIRQGSVDLGMT